MGTRDEVGTRFLNTIMSLCNIKCNTNYYTKGPAKIRSPISDSWYLAHMLLCASRLRQWPCFDLLVVSASLPRWQWRSLLAWWSTIWKRCRGASDQVNGQASACSCFFTLYMYGYMNFMLVSFNQQSISSLNGMQEILRTRKNIQLLTAKWQRVAGGMFLGPRLTVS